VEHRRRRRHFHAGAVGKLEVAAHLPGQQQAGVGGMERVDDEGRDLPGQGR